MTSTDTIEAACFELARTTKWARRPIDAQEITSLAERYSVIAKRELSPGFIEEPVVARAIRYIAQAHGMPMDDDTSWFVRTLRALLEVACPNSGLDEQGQEFLQDMLAGIEEAREI